MQIQARPAAKKYTVYSVVGIPILLASALAFFVFRGSPSHAWPFIGYPGTAGPFIAFNICFLMLLLSAMPKPRCYAYTFLAILLFLGFWSKLITHFLVPGNGGFFVEPVGSFDHMGPHWDRALNYATAGAAGALLARMVFIFIRPKFQLLNEKARTVPAWYMGGRTTTWISTFLAVVGLNALNYFVAFYQIGVNPRLVLPLHLNVIAAWLINIGFAQWIATLVWWEQNVHTGRSALPLLAPLAEGVIATCSTLSRSVGFLHVVPYLFSLIQMHGWKPLFKTRKRIVAAMGLLVLFAMVIALVQGLRAQTYYNNPDVKSQFTRQAPAGESESETEARYAKHVRDAAIYQLPLLVTQRWVGLEAVLAVSSHSQIGPELFKKALVESPKDGQDSIYQKIAGSSYEKSSDFTFLTLAGVIGFLTYAGSLTVVILGMCVVTITIHGIDFAAWRLTGNPFLVSVTGLAIANVLCQMNYLYLTIIVFIQVIVALIFLWLIQKPFLLLKQKVTVSDGGRDN
jgi:hypothetical protein